MDKSVNLQFNVNELNVILAALGAQPYSQVFGVVAKIQAAAEAQLKEEPIEDTQAPADAA